MSPQRTDLVLASDVPDVELCVLVCDGLDVEADGGDGGYILVKFELVQDCCRTVLVHALLFREWLWGRGGVVLVFPAASRPSMSRRISLDPKILFIILDIWPPIVSDVCWCLLGGSVLRAQLGVLGACGVCGAGSERQDVLGWHRDTRYREAGGGAPDRLSGWVGVMWEEEDEEQE